MGCINMSGCYIRQEPYVGDNGIYVPVNEYAPEDCVSMYRCIMTKKMFVEAYNKWIKSECNIHITDNDGDDDADCWCE